MRQAETLWEDSRTKFYEIEVFSQIFKRLQSVYLIPRDIAQY